MTASDSSKAPRFFRRVSFWWPTWRTGLAALAALALLTLGPGRRLHHFLSLQDPVEANLLIVEGWLPDYALRDAVTEFGRGGYDYLVASGGPMERGTLVSGYATYAAIAAASLRRMGVPSDRVLEAPASRTYRNRTFQSARSVAQLLRARRLQPRGLNVVTAGPHARRTLVVYRKTFGDQTPVGVLSVPPQDYDPERWWRSSEGLKVTVTETFGWLYESLLSSGR